MSRGKAFDDYSPMFGNGLNTMEEIPTTPGSPIYFIVRLFSNTIQYYFGPNMCLQVAHHKVLSH